MNKQMLESALLFVLVLNIFRSQLIVNQFAMILVAFALIVFILLSISSKITRSIPKRVRSFCLWFIILTLYLFLLRKHIVYRALSPETALIHDGAIYTELATEALLSGKNPYSASFAENLPGRPSYVVDRYVYSPMTFLVNVPFHIGGDFLFGKPVDIRITFAVALILTSLIGALVIKEKLLFWIMFLFNPLFVYSLFIGTTDVLTILFIVCVVVSLYFRRISLATVFLALGFGSKLLVVPFIPLYFLYIYELYRKKKDWARRIGKEILVFAGVSMLIYLPFVVWNPGAILDDLLFYPLLGGSQRYPITGYIGLPHLLVSLGILSIWSSFPFYLVQLVVTIFLLILMYYFLKSKLELSVLCFLYVIFFIVSFSFSRVFQPNYLDFLSEILIFACFVPGARGRIKAWKWRAS